MTTLLLDVLSDIHSDTRPEFDWSDQPTSPTCIVLGNVSDSIEHTVKTLEHLADCYGSVFYIDGHCEHSRHLNSLGASYSALQSCIEHIEGLTYLQDNLVLVDGVAILGTNGWTTFDFDSSLSSEQAISQWAERHSISENAAASVYQLARCDAAYLCESVSRLQRMPDVKTIIVCTNSVPRADLLAHDKKLAASVEFSSIGNSMMSTVLEHDTDNKIKMWLFGNYHGSVDVTLDNVRYICNSQGRRNDPDCVRPYYPRRVQIVV